MNLSAAATKFRDRTGNGSKRIPTSTTVLARISAGQSQENYAQGRTAAIKTRATLLAGHDVHPGQRLIHPDQQQEYQVCRITAHYTLICQKVRAGQCVGPEMSMAPEAFFR